MSKVTEWVCGRDNKDCPLQQEFGGACRRSIKHHHCSRPISSIPGASNYSDAQDAMTRIFVKRKLEEGAFRVRIQLHEQAFNASLAG
jgi:hypothetical protein